MACTLSSAQKKGRGASSPVVGYWITSSSGSLSVRTHGQSFPPLVPPTVPNTSSLRLYTVDYSVIEHTERFHIFSPLHITLAFWLHHLLVQ